MDLLAVLFVSGLLIASGTLQVARATYTFCPELTYTLRFGSRDTLTNGQVSRLQQFLAADETIYPEGLVTGYFGRLTEVAVKRWQEKFGVYYERQITGIVGSLTRAKMQELCEDDSLTDGESLPESSVEVVGRNGVFEKNYFENVYLQKYVLRIEASDRDYYFKIPGEGFDIVVPRGTTAMVDIGPLRVGTRTFTCGTGCSGTIVVRTTP